MKPATYSTPEPPESLKSDPEAMEYAQALRRRVEVQNAQLEALTEQLRKAQEAHEAMRANYRTLQRNTTQPHMEPPRDP